MQRKKKFQRETIRMKSKKKSFPFFLYLFFHSVRDTGSIIIQWNTSRLGLNSWQNFTFVNLSKADHLHTNRNLSKPCVDRLVLLCINAQWPHCVWSQLGTPRRELKNQRVAAYLWRASRCLEMCSNTVLIFYISSKTRVKTKEKLRKNQC